MNYYNENDPMAAAWLRELISAKLIPNGVVDERSIEDVLPADLFGFTQCHFFAGIGGWSLALSLAGWPSDRPVWTGSCPCQPFSTAGKGDGFDSPHHLWPSWAWLISECRPSIIFGEQVAAKAGRAWFSFVQADLQAMGYAAAAADICAAGIGAPHWRQRLWFVGMADAERNGQHGSGKEARGRQLTDGGDVGGMAEPGSFGSSAGLSESVEGKSGVAEVTDNGSDGFTGPTGRAQRGNLGEPFASALDGFWRDADWLLCTDGRWRPVEPGSSPLVTGVHGRVGLLRGYGNAIVPQVAAEVIGAVM